MDVKPVLTLGQSVTTPNGPGTYQFPLWSDGDIYHMVSHPIKATINPDLCRALYGGGKGIWWLAGYNLDQVEATK
jgi:hypothetical protein